MADMKIGEVDEDYSGAVFTFPDNPRTVDTPTNPDKKYKSSPMGRMHYATDYGGTEPKPIVMNGEFRGSSKRSDYNDLAFHVNDDNLKKLFISDDRFYYALGQRCKDTISGDRVRFVDYVAAFWTPIPYAFGDTENTYTVSISDANAHTLNDATSGSTGSFDNSGGAPSFVRWEIENTGTANITKVEIGDSAESGGSVQGDRKTIWNGTLSAGETLTIYIIKFVEQSSGGKFTKYAYAEIDGSQSGNVKSVGFLTGLPYIPPETTDHDFSIQLTGNDGATVTAKFRDAYRS